MITEPKKKNYVYPKLSKYDFYITRIGGMGLGNLLFPYARALVFAKKNNCEIIWPTWNTIPIGQIIRRERPKRFYNDVFENKSNYVDGMSKIKLLMTKKKVTEEYAMHHIEELQDTIIVFEGMKDCFDNIKYDYDLVGSEIVSNLHRRTIAKSKIDTRETICVHVRLGDFVKATEQELQSGKHNSSIPITWYVAMIKKIRKEHGNDMQVYVFSDGTDEQLQELLSVPKVQRVTGGTALGDIIAMSHAKYFVASGSSFSMWVRYLGRMTSYNYLGQLKQHILTDEEDESEWVGLE